LEGLTPTGRGFGPSQFWREPMENKDILQIVITKNPDGNYKIITMNAKEVVTVHIADLPEIIQDILDIEIMNLVAP
jgi:hypothetical protein